MQLVLNYYQMKGVRWTWVYKQVKGRIILDSYMDNLQLLNLDLQILSNEIHEVKPPLFASTLTDIVIGNGAYMSTEWLKMTPVRYCLGYLWMAWNHL